jgi:hypothetical protein
MRRIAVPRTPACTTGGILAIVVVSVVAAAIVIVSLVAGLGSPHAAQADNSNKDPQQQQHHHQPSHSAAAPLPFSPCVLAAGAFVNVTADDYVLTPMATTSPYNGRPHTTKVRIQFPAPRSSCSTRALAGQIRVVFIGDEHTNHTWDVTPSTVKCTVDLSPTNLNTVPVTCVRTVIAPERVLKVFPTWNVTLNNGATNVTARLNRGLSVTCSDGLYCNGEERYIGKVCQRAGAPDVVPPCGLNSPDPCYRYRCIEEERSCARQPEGTESSTAFCDTCDLAHCTPWCGPKQECGFDGCGRPCGRAIDEGLCMNITGARCVSGKCVVQTVDPNRLGTCQRPYPLFAQLLDPTFPRTTSNIPLDGLTVPANEFLEARFLIDTSDNTDDYVTPSCGAAGVPDALFTFTLPPNVSTGFEMRLSGPLFDLDQLDTLLEIRYDCTTDLGYPAGTCSDDARPPGGLGSRIFGLLTRPGSYMIVATGYSTNNLGPALLQVKFNNALCVPQCDGRDCGDDGCGGSCGACSGTDCCYVCPPGSPCEFGQYFCTQGSRLNATDEECVPGSFTCTPDCGGRACGPSINRCPDRNTSEVTTCGSYDGDCKGDKACQREEGKCVPYKPCDPYAPVCDPPGPALKGKKVYCGTDCLNHVTDEPVIDLIVNNRIEVETSIRFVWTNVSTASCAVFEKCLEGTGTRLLMRFDTRAGNIGTAGFTPPTARQAPNLFEYNYCHGHYHYNGFARYEVQNMTTRLPVIRAGKISYCMEDTERMLDGPAIPCVAQGQCDRQSISRGWVDLYAWTLDCQWSDLTDVPRDTMYNYLVESNFARTFNEYSFENNLDQFPIWVPKMYKTNEAPGATGTVQYCDLLRYWESNNSAKLVSLGFPVGPLPPAYRPVSQGGRCPEPRPQDFAGIINL